MIARSRASGDGSGADWLYSYLRGFYRDPSPPHRLEQHGFRERRHAARALPAAGQCRSSRPKRVERRFGPKEEEVDGTRCTRLVLEKPGTMAPAEYDRMVADLVNFLVYVGEPARHERQRTLGIYVLMFLGVLFVLAYAAEEGILEGRSLIGDR